ncbi:MAG: hypothetical protein JXA08_09960 [Methanomicrobiaceae archaeon]|nr:hypothetical protein [Methanomicrobiaceae archaeon]
MDPRVLDISTSAASLVLLIVSLAILPLVLPSGYAYLAALMIFIVAMSAAGYVIAEKIV